MISTGVTDIFDHTLVGIFNTVLFPEAETIGTTGMEESTLPPVQEKTQSPKVQETMPPSPVQDTTPPLPEQETTPPPPPVQETLSPLPVQETTAPPPVQETTASIPVQETTALPAVQDTTPPLPQQEETAPSPVQESTPSLQGQETTGETTEKPNKMTPKPKKLHGRLAKSAASEENSCLNFSCTPNQATVDEDLAHGEMPTVAQCAVWCSKLPQCQ